MVGSLTSGEGVLLLVRGPGTVWVQTHKSGAHGRALHLSTFQLNLSRVCHTSPCPPV